MLGFKGLSEHPTPQKLTAVVEGRAAGEGAVPGAATLHGQHAPVRGAPGGPPDAEAVGALVGCGDS